MRFNDGETVYRVQCRFWEQAENPHKETISGTQKIDVPVTGNKQFDLLVIDEVGDRVYVPSSEVFYKRENAIKAGKLKTELYNLIEDDHFNTFFQRDIMNKMKKNP